MAGIVPGVTALVTGKLCAVMAIVQVMKHMKTAQMIVMLLANVMMAI